MESVSHARDESQAKQQVNLSRAAERPQPPKSEDAKRQQTDREHAYSHELLHIFRQRLHLLSSMALLMLPLFAMLHAVLSPLTRREVACVHAFMVVICLVARVLSFRVASLRAIRILAMVCYASFALGAAFVGTHVSQPHLNAPISNSFVVYSSFNQIVLSLLVLPFGLWEAALLALIVMLAMGVSSSALQIPLPLTNGDSSVEPFFWSHLFVLGATSFVVLCLAHLNALQRRGAFNAAWELERTASELEKLSVLDAVTGGWNRHHLEHVLHDEIARSVRFERDFSVLMFDLDFFKGVNDTHGHTLGDEVLREIHAAALQTVREIDTVARYGGDEFLVVLPETDAASAAILAQRLQETAKQRLIRRWGETHTAAQVTLSIGVWTQHENRAIEVDELIAHVDEKLYSAKRAGKNRIAV